MSMSPDAMSWLMEGSRDLHMLRRERTAANQARRGRGGFIRDKVAAARSAGIHPLYALGAQASPRSSIVGTDKGGGGFATGPSKSEQVQAAKESESRIKANEAAAARDNALAAKAASDAAIAKQKANSTQDTILTTPSGDPVHVTQPDLTDEAQRHYGELGELVYGTEAFVRDHTKAAKKKYKELKKVRKHRPAKLTKKARQRLKFLRMKEFLNYPIPYGQ